MKKDKIIFWSATTIMFLFQGVMPALTSHTEMAREGIRQLGYPAYFGTLLAIFKVAGAVVLMFPQFPKRLREWHTRDLRLILFLPASVTALYMAWVRKPSRH